MATTNFIQTNPAQMNQENDAAYLADSQRTGGFARNDEVPSILLNKMQFQASTFITAFCNMLVAKGITTSDADIAVLATALASVQTTADMTGPLNVIPFAATPAYDAAAFSGFQMTLTGNLTGPTISGQKAGQKIRFAFQQDATGGRTVAWPAGVAVFSVVDLSPNAWTVVDFFVTSDLQLRAVSNLYSGLVVVPGAGIGAYGDVSYDTGVVVPAGFGVAAVVSGADPSGVITVSFAINAAGHLEARMKNPTGGGSTAFANFNVSYRLFA